MPSMDFKLENVHLEKCCRFCLMEKDDVRPIQVLDSVVQMIKILCDLEIQVNNGLPDVVCEFCNQEIEKYYLFHQQIINSDLILKEALQEHKQYPEIKVENFSDIEESVSSPNPEPTTKNNHECDIGQKEVKIIHSLEGNINDHSQFKKVQCNECGKKFFDRKDLTIHMRSHTGEKPYSCTVCFKAFATSSQVSVHMKIHTKEKPYKCKVCQKCFPYSGSLVTHMRIHAGTKFMCYCGKSFTQKFNLDNHVRTKHTDERPFMCSECGQRYPTKDQLKNHIRHHKPDVRKKEHQCESCPKAFMTARELSIHVRIHTNETPYQCDLCGTKFKTSSQMNSHRRIHTGQKNHVCSYCQKAFRESSTLKIHIRTHTGDRPYTCSICKMSFTQSNTLTTHMRIHKKDAKVDSGIANSSNNE